MNKKSVQNALWAIVYALWIAVTFDFLSVWLVYLPIHLFANERFYVWLATPLGTLLLQTVLYAITIVIILAPFFIRKLPWIKIRAKLGVFKRFKLSMIPWALYVWGLYFIASGIITVVLSYFPVHGLNLDQAQDVGFEGLTNVFGYIAAFTLLVVVAPVAEELLFRGYLFGRIRERSGFWFSAVITSWTFAVLHGQLNVGIDVFILSLFLCYLREKFDSIWPGVLVHGLKNGMAFVLLFILPLYGIQWF